MHRDISKNNKILKKFNEIHDKIKDLLDNCL